DPPPLPELRERASEHAVVCLVKLLHLRRRWYPYGSYTYKEIFMSTKTLNFGKPAKVVAYEMALALATKKADTPSELLSLLLNPFLRSSCQN
ncbi:hypothetical protein, partial [Serratia marcescens]|uniref:hypothetical protein n=1 Tax=Serratia marcescens TaxID=615 RepID=UPI003EC6DCC3